MIGSIGITSLGLGRRVCHHQDQELHTGLPGWEAQRDDSVQMQPRSE